MKKLNKLSKIISVIITVCMSISVCSVSIVFADGDPILADHTYDYYKTVDTTQYALNTYGIYMESKYANLTYNTAAFVSAGYDDGIYAAIAWPPALKTRTVGDGYPAQNATITKKGSDYIVRSNRTKAKYKMPARITPTDGQVSSANAIELNEAIIIEHNRSYSGGITRGMYATVPIGKSYERIHFLVGHAGVLTGDNRIGQIQAHVVYEDGTTTLPKKAKVEYIDWAGKNRIVFPAGLIDAPESNGDNGYVCETLPLVTAKGQSAADNFVADFVTYVSISGVNAGTKSTYEGQFSTTNSRTTHAAFEYTLELDPTKVVREIIFSQTTGRGGYAVLGISGENEKEDWTDKVAQINDAITNLEAKGANASASEVSETMEMVNSAIEAGVENHVNIEKFNSLFSNGEFTENLVDTMLAEVDLEDVTWDDTTNKFKDLDDVASVIEETGNFETCPAKEKILNAYTGMIDSLINEEEENNDKMIERFELLKSAKTDAFQEIFEEKLIYNKEDPSLSTDPEFVTLDVDFSKPVNSTTFVEDNFEVLFGNEKINSSWIKVVKKLTGVDITGAKVKVRNSQDYTKTYTFNISRDLKGVNNESWGYQLTRIENASAPFTAEAKEIQFDDSDRTIEGKIAFNNASGSTAPCVLMIMSYDEDGKCLGAIYARPANGSAAKGASNIDFSGTLPEGAKEVKCYVYNSVTSMTLLTPPVSIVIPVQ